VLALSQAAETARFSKRLPLQCKAEAKHVADVWYINIDRKSDETSDQPPKFATGEFDARVPVWVTFENGQQLVTVDVGASTDGARVDSGTVSTGLMITDRKIVYVDNPTKCEAFVP